MIDVPILVKDALRDGSHRKNYRFKVLQTTDVNLYDSRYTFISGSTTYTVDQTGDYYLYSAASSKAFVSYAISLPGGGGSYERECPVGDGETNVYIGRLTPNTVVSIFGLQTPSLTLNLYVETVQQESEIFTIDNDNLVSESVTIDERMCSDDTIKYGLCEGSSLEFQYFGLENINGCRIQAFIDVEYGAAEPYTIPMGYFTVKKCSRQASTGIIKVTAYNKLQSDYLDAKANSLLEEQFTSSATVTLFDIQSILLSDYQINEVERERIEGGGLVSPWPIEIEHLFQIEESYGVDTFFNSYVLSDYVGTGFKLCIERYDTQYNSVADARTEAFSGSLMKLERIVADWVCEVIGNAHIGVTPGRVFEAIRSGEWGIDFADIFSVYINGKICSTIQYEYDMETQGYSNLGTIQDAWVLKDAYNATIYTIGHIGVIAPNGSAGDETIYLDMTGKANAPGKTSGGSYYYYADAQHNLALGHTEPFRSSDGVAYDTGINLDYLTVFSYPYLPPALTVEVNISDLEDFTLRDIVSATYETVCQFGQLDRVTDLFSGVELNHTRLLPAETLYPANSLYPGGADASGFRSMYSKLWADEGNIHKWKDLIITYKGIEGGQTKDLIYQTTINPDGTDNYNMSDNWIFRNLTWTSTQVKVYADAMVAKMRDITWFPFEMWCAGLPYLETGDEIEIPLGEDTYISYVLQRQLKGIQNLQDTYINGTLDIF